MEEPIVNKEYLLEKIPGKGGWTYAIIPEIIQDKKNRFGWVKVKGSIDNFELKNYKLMPMGNGALFLPVRSEIRKFIQKKEGDTVKIILFFDNDPAEIPEELLLCLRDEPKAYEAFFRCSDGQQKEYVNWIYSAKTDNTKVERIASLLDKLLNKSLPRLK